MNRVLKTVAVGLALVAPGLAPARAVTYIDWPAFMHDTSHSSFQHSAAAITTSNASSLSAAWTWKPAAGTSAQPPNTLFATPAVYHGVVYEGANTGIFYALNESTGKVLWHRDLGYEKTFTCFKRGIISSASVLADPNTGTPIVYVGGGAGQLFALDGTTGSVIWKAQVVNTGNSSSQNAGYMWGSPAVANGKVYIGMSSDCDSPLIRGGVKAYDATTGKKVATFFTVGSKTVGGSVWSSNAVDPNNGSVYVTTGNGPGPNSESVLRLDGSSLSKLDGWQIPSGEQIVDSDFGASPTLFSATLNNVSTPMVGACNKNGIFYAWKRANLSAGPVWRRTMGPGRGGGAICVAGAVWDSSGNRLFAAGTDMTIGGKSYPGSVSQLNPATGVPVWTTGISAGPVLGGPTLDGGGVLAVVTFNESSPSANKLYLLNASNGNILATYSANGATFPQPVFADGYLFFTQRSGGIQALKP